MINEEDVQTFSILDNKTIVLTDKLNQKRISDGKKFVFLFIVVFSCFLSIITQKNSLLSDLIIITGGVLIGSFMFLDFGLSKWIEFDRATRQCTIYKNIQKKKIVRSFAYGEYVFNHHNMGTPPNVRHCITLHCADDPNAHKWYTFITGFGYYVTEEEIEAFRIRLVNALENWFDNKPYDKAIIRHASEKDIIR